MPLSPVVAVSDVIEGDFTRRAAEFIGRLQRHRKGVLFGTLALAATSALGFQHIGIDNRFGIWFSPTDPTSVNYNRFQEEFGTDETLILVYRNDSLFTPKELRFNASLTEALAAVSHVRSILSLSTLEVPRLTPFGPVMVPLIPDRAGDRDQLRSELLGKAILRDNVISADGTATGFRLTLDTRVEKERLATVDSIRSLVGSPPFDTNQIFLVGNIPIRAEMYRVSASESGRFVAISAAVMLILIWLYFSSLAGAAAAVCVSVLTVLGTFGLFSALGFSLNMVSGIMPLVLMVVSLSVSVHIISRVDSIAGEAAVGNAAGQRNLAEGAGEDPRLPEDPPPLEVIFREAVAPILKPCLFSSLTTASAFASFLLSGIGPLRVFGAFCSIGVLLSLGLAFLLVPVVLTLGNRLPGSFGRRRRHDLGRALEGLLEGTLSHRRLVFGGAAVALLVAIIGFGRLTFETDQIKYLHASNPIRVANRVAKEWFTGVYPLEVVLELQDSIQNRPAHYLDLLTHLEEEISALEEVAVVHSAATGIRDFIPEGLFRPLALASLRSPENRAETEESGPRGITQLRYLNRSGTEARLSVKARWMSNEETRILMAKLDSILEPVALEEEFSFYHTGVAPMSVSINRRLTRSQMTSFLTSFVCIFLLLLLLFRSPSLAGIGMIPNVLPVLTTVGVMGLAGVPMDVATVLIAAISLGIAVDDTIHFLWAYRERRGKGESEVQALDGAIRGVGRPLVLTSLVLMGGFLTMTLSSYLPLVFLGIFVSLNVFLAILFDIILLPVLISFRFERQRMGAI
jgi:predicted RND superfamily exporter protein